MRQENPQAPPAFPRFFAYRFVYPAVFIPLSGRAADPFADFTSFAAFTAEPSREAGW